MRAMKIALCTHSVNPRGGVVHTLELARALHESGHDVTVFAPARGGETLFRPTPFEVILARVDGARDTVGMVDERIRALKQALRGKRFDVLHAQDSISANALAELKEAGAIRGFVRTVHHLDDFSDERLAQWQRRAWQDADEVLCVSETWTRIMRDIHGIHARTVANGVDTRRYGACADAGVQALRERFGLNEGPVVLTVGGIEARKNTLTLLDAFAMLRARRPSAQLVVAGGASLLDHDAYARRFFARADALNLRVVVTGPLPDEAMPALFRMADIVPMISLREGFGLVVLEALASGRPVVASRIAPFTEYLDDATCTFADPLDASDVAEALHRALDLGPPDAHALLRRFTWQRSARSHLAIYEQWLATTV